MWKRVKLYVCIVCGGGGETVCAWYKALIVYGPGNGATRSRSIRPRERLQESP